MAAGDTSRKFRLSLLWDDHGTAKTWSEVVDDPEAKVSIGRKGVFVVKGAGVDDVHCLIRLDSKGTYYVMDNGSESGTFFSVDGSSFTNIGSAAMSRNDRKRNGKTLADNNVIRIGDQDIKVTEVVELTILMPNRQLLLQVLHPPGDASRTDEPPFLMKFRFLTIGRKSGENPKNTNEVMVVKDTDRKVSREHCKILLERRHRIEDVSQLGTFIKRGPVPADAIFTADNWHQVPKRERADINSGDIIRLADSVYIRVMDPTENGRAPLPPVDLRVVERTTTTVRVEWSPPPVDGNPLPVKGYRLQQAVGGEEWKTLMGGEVTVFEVQDLEPNTSYTFRAQAQNDIGFSEQSVQLVVRTMAPAVETDDAVSQQTMVRE